MTDPSSIRRLKEKARSFELTFPAELDPKSVFSSLADMIPDGEGLIRSVSTTNHRREGKLTIVVVITE